MTLWIETVERRPTEWAGPKCVPPLACHTQLTDRAPLASPGSPFLVEINTYTHGAD